MWAAEGRAGLGAAEAQEVGDGGQGEGYGNGSTPRRGGESVRGQWLRHYITKTSGASASAPLHKYTRRAFPLTASIPSLPPRSLIAAPQISGDGEILDLLHDPDGSRVAFISAVSESGGRLFIGNLVEDYVSVLDLAAAGVTSSGDASH